MPFPRINNPYRQIEDPDPTAERPGTSSHRHRLSPHSPPQPSYEFQSFGGPPTGSSGTHSTQRDYFYQDAGGGGFRDDSPDISHEYQSLSGQQQARKKQSVQSLWSVASPDLIQTNPNGTNTGLILREHTHSGQPRGAKSWGCFWFTLIVALLWTVPAVVLLVLNLKATIIGASAWCPTRNCTIAASSVSFGNSQLNSKLQAYDSYNHNLLGSLQFVAKALEVWFVFLAVGLVYLVTSWLARSQHGIPIGHLLTYIEFSDLLNIINPVLWTAALNPQDKRDDVKKLRRRVFVYYAFAIFAGFMCIMANLIGPSVAVLVIPNLGWRDMPIVYDQRFGEIQSASPPKGNWTIPGCLEEDLAKGNYSCTLEFYSFSFDSLFYYTRAQMGHNSLINRTENVNNIASPLMPEKALNIRFNYSSTSKNSSIGTYWAPNRQLVRALSDDVERFYSAGDDPSSRYATYNDSLYLFMQRQGPVIGVDSNSFIVFPTTTVVDANRSIRCFSPWYGRGSSSIAKCFRMGTGWNETSTVSKFYVGGQEQGLTNGSDREVVNSTVFFSDKATYIQSSLSGNDTPACFTNGTLPSDANCDYDQLFSPSSFPPNLPVNLTASVSITNAFIWELSSPGIANVSMVMETFYSMGMCTYSVDVTPQSPTFGDVEINSYPDSSVMADPGGSSVGDNNNNNNNNNNINGGGGSVVPIALDSSWMLAAWSVNDGDQVPWVRFPARELQIVLSGMLEAFSLDDPDSQLPLEWALEWVIFAINSSLEAASLVTYSFTDPSKDGLKTDPNDQSHPELGNNVTRQVWAFGTDSRTSKLGIAVTLVGILTAVARAVMALATRIRHRSPVELLVAAMKHTPKNEFNKQVGRDEKLFGRVRFEIFDDLQDRIHFLKH